MKSVNEIIEFLEHVRFEYGGDTSIVLQVKDYEGFVHGDYCINFGLNDAGTVFFVNYEVKND